MLGGGEGTYGSLNVECVNIACKAALANVWIYHIQKSALP